MMYDRYHTVRMKGEDGMEWVVLVNGEDKAMFKEELDAMQYRDFLKNLYRMGGYKDKVEIKKASGK